MEKQFKIKQEMQAITQAGKTAEAVAKKLANKELQIKKV